MVKSLHLTRRQGMLLLACVAFNFLVYFFGRGLSAGRPHWNLTTGLDRQIPFLPWTITIYWGCVAFWAVNYVLSVRREADRFVTAHLLGETVCFVCFVCLPTTMARPAVEGGGVFPELVRLTYQADAADNLLPSIHCFVSWLSWAGVRGRPEIPRGYQWFSLGMAVLVCISTLTVKQHVLADAAAGILLCEVCWRAAGRLSPGREPARSP